ncbi:DapH/DapD/GlmU-related protein [Dyadobacter jiangsuensis]|uniref:Acetyltransferase-like isoleucine patch superfamily enzyme n=1 Tax=Dyadobacter jiangsuensis TaxID=1591085 RepID=A0A2P8GBX0_9BACT|nr:DapH/DapD/GlmU-related protein [Dyadobacter jiangsuensis]PSL31460.1 acetyltransferase-like isoleucine patch superfamily enzyme [Dyadobacter jiangsuensis]
MESNTNIFDRMRAGETIRKDDPGYDDFGKVVARTIRLCTQMNAQATDTDQVRDRLSEIFGTRIDESTTIFPPFYTNFGQFTTLGKNVFINHACSFLDIGGITIEDDVLIGPRVNITSENHPLDPSDRQALIPKPVHIKRNAWIGAGATILPGVTVGENAVVAAGAVVSRDVPPNTVVAGIPAKVVKDHLAH